MQILQTRQHILIFQIDFQLHGQLLRTLGYGNVFYVGILEQVAKEAADDVVIGKVNIDDNKELAAKFEVVNIPRMFLYKDGKIVQEFNGIQSKPKLLDALKNA